MRCQQKRPKKTSSSWAIIPQRGQSSKMKAERGLCLGVTGGPLKAITEEWRFPGQWETVSHSFKKEYGIMLRTDLMTR